MCRRRAEAHQARRHEGVRWKTEFNNRRRSKLAGSESCGLAPSLFSGALCHRPVLPPPTHHNRPRRSWKRQAHSPRITAQPRPRKARRRLRRLFDAARRKAKGQARLCRADEYEVLRCAYRAVRAWRSDGVHEKTERELRAEAEVAVSRHSSLFLVLIRCAIPSLDIKRASKWAAALDTADRQDIRSKHLSAFLHHSGGIEGAARKRLSSEQVFPARCAVPQKHTHSWTPIE